MRPELVMDASDVLHRLREAESTIDALLAGQIDAVVEGHGNTPLLLYKAQEALRESEERYRRIVETANEGIWTLDAECRITFSNARLAEMLGYPPESMFGRSYFELVPRAGGTAAALRVERSRRGLSDEGEVAFRRSDGSVLWGLLKTSPIHDANGVYVGTLAMMTDRTQHHEDELALRKSEEQYRQIVEAMSDGILKIDPAAEVQFVNRKLAEMLGYEPAEMIGESVFAFMNDAERAVVAGWFTAAADEDRLDTILRHKDGSDVAVTVVGTRVIDAAGRHRGHVARVLR